ncbi:hypothetical protein MNB_SM-5-374 [hydrothermal vent metagenome]|uniref:Uncharacterized protein n=1 Tax=hydrothermal vent metagenome TaxID=652676 RepID=A0A1W1C095_9ZZZZ
MQKDIYQRIISFLLGASWAIVLFGALLTFKIFISFGIIVALFTTLLFIIISLFLILLLDSFEVRKETLAELKKQRELLEKIYAKESK